MNREKFIEELKKAPRYLDHERARELQVESLGRADKDTLLVQGIQELAELTNEITLELMSSDYRFSGDSTKKDRYNMLQELADVIITSLYLVPAMLDIDPEELCAAVNVKLDRIEQRNIEYAEKHNK